MSEPVPARRSGAGSYRGREINRAEVPRRGELVDLAGLEGRVVKVTPCYAGIWVLFNGAEVPTLYTWRRNIAAWRAFPENVDEPNLTID